MTGSIDEVIPLQEQAIRFGPGDPFIGVLYLRIGLVHLLQSRIAEAIGAFEKTRIGFPAEMVDVHAYLAAAYALKGETEHATAELVKARDLAHDGRYSSISRLNPPGFFGLPNIHALYEKTLFAGLRKAGVPDE